MVRQLVLFAKLPRPGRVKTRLVPPLSPRQALLLYRAFLEDQIRFLRSFEDDCRVELCLDGAPGEEERAIPGMEGLALGLQGEGDLGRRLLGAFERLWRAGARATVVVGADSPTLPAGHVRAALRRLDAGGAAVVSPAADGGYVLIGLREPRPELFRDVPWGGPGVLAATRRRARSHGLALEEIAGWYDVDDGAAVERLRRELRDCAARRRAPATAACLDTLDGRPGCVV